MTDVDSTIGVRCVAGQGLAAGLLVAVVALMPAVVPGPVVGGGRDITFVQLGYYSAALVIRALVASTLNLAVAATRVVALARLRRPAGDVPPPEASAQASAQVPAR
ncbi:hypothetical protein [Saccharothrix deserti]|uniref:hypothetical protein n=1 Tax=Saccharothrix deserti TaxID=2593674 RepID=UPI00131BF02C|nr:hypothetical protein [Saccharothrix deserti]